MLALALTGLLLQAPIAGIEVRGNRLVPEESILYHAGLGGAASRKELEAAFRRLWETGLFEDVRVDSEPSRDGLRLVVTVEEKPLLRESRILGEGFDEAQLRGALGIRLAPRRPFGESDRQEVERFLRRILGADYDVAARLQEVSEVRVDLVLDVKRVEKPRIERIEFRGNGSLADGELLRVMALRPSGFVSRLTRRDRYDAETLEADVEKIGRLYRRRGYAAASAGPAAARPNASGKIVIEIPVVEGELHRFGAVGVEPGLLLSLEEARAFLPEAGDRYDVRAIDEAAERLTSHYLERGYPEVRIERRETVDPSERVVDVALRVDEGRFLRFGFVTFHGHLRHRDRDLRPFLEAVESERFDPRRVDASIRALMSTGNLAAVTPEVDLEARPARGDVDLHVEEKPPFDYLVGGGLTGVQGGTGGGQLLARGLLGRGETWSLDLDLGDRFRNVVVGYRDPSILGRRVFLAGDFRRTSLTFPDDTGEDTTDVALRAGGLLGASSQLLGGVRFLSFTLDSSLEDDVPFLTPFLGTRFDTVRASAGLVHETRDRAVLASRGRRLAFGYELVSGDVELQRLRVDATVLAPVDRAGRHVVTLSGRAEAVVPHGATVERGVPRFERLFLGSENDLRGFPIRGVGPRSGANVVGGDRLVLATAAYRYSPFSRLGLEAFFDAGNVFATDFEGDPLPDLRYDAGGEAQILLPVANVPLRIGYGFNLDRVAEEPRGRFFVSLALRF